MARPPLTDEQVRAKVASYCERYSVTPGPDGLPPFPTGRRETGQHREWQTVYRALQRLALRAASDQPSPEEAARPIVTCPVCSRTLERALGVPYARRSGAPRSPAPLHPACAELARLAETLGQGAVAGVTSFLWPARARSARAR
jgi:hypothetical protein